MLSFDWSLRASDSFEILQLFSWKFKKLNFKHIIARYIYEYFVAISQIAIFSLTDRTELVWTSCAIDFFFRSGSEIFVFNVFCYSIFLHRKFYNFDWIFENPYGFKEEGRGVGKSYDSHFGRMENCSYLELRAVVIKVFQQRNIGFN